MKNIQKEFGLKKMKNQVKHSSVILILVFLFFTAYPSMSYSVDMEVVDRIVAIVNDELITYSMLNEAFKPFDIKIREKNYPLEKEIEIRFKVRNNLIQQLIDQEITEQEMKKAQIQVSDEEIDGYIERIKQTNSFTQEDLRRMLEAEGVELGQYRKEIKSLLLRNKLIQYEIKSKIVITKEEIDEYYTRHKDEFNGKTREEVSPLIMDKLYQTQADEKFSKWISDLREQAQIKIIQ
ncbi:MAG: SurA N-terminal domain-containing protein [Proteobacteria bacterium]|nr:SurA N-terminal domain-containing protein [Pseudomonadota bacterium]